MAKGVNKVILIGNIGNDPEVKYMPNGEAVVNIGIATSESWKDKNTGEKVDKTEWHQVVFFRKLAEIVGKYLKKGSKIYIEGKLHTRKWKDKNGNDRYTTEIVANEMQMLDSKGDNDVSIQAKLKPSTHNGQAQMNNNLQQKINQSKQAAPTMSDYDDDIPFS